MKVLTYFCQLQRNASLQHGVSNICLGNTTVLRISGNSKAAIKTLFHIIENIINASRL